MKLLTFVMAFLVLALSCLPCADGESTAVSSDRIKTEVAHSQQQDDDHEDACSPFCHCICCTGISVNHVMAIAIVPAPQTSINHSSFHNPSIAEVSLPVWQPPKLS